MTPQRIYIGEYANYFVTNGEAWTHDNNKLSKYAIPEKVTENGAAGHPYGYVIGESGALYMLTGDNTLFKKIADGVKLVSAYWDWVIVVGKDNLITLYQKGVKYCTLKQISDQIVQVAAAHYILFRTVGGIVYQFNWSNTPWKSGVVWQKTSAVLVALDAVRVTLPGPATWITTSRLFFSAAIVNGVVYAWGDPGGAKYFGWTGAFAPKVVSGPAKMTIVEASDHTLHAIDTEGFAYGQGGLGVGFVGDGRKEPEVIATGGWPDMVVKTFVKTFVKLNDRKYDTIAPGSSYKFRNALKEVGSTWNFWGYPKFGLDMTGIRPQDDSSAVGLFASATPQRRDIPAELIPKTTAELKASGYPPPEFEPLPEPRKVVALLYDDGTWENPEE